MMTVKVSRWIATGVVWRGSESIVTFFDGRMGVLCFFVYRRLRFLLCCVIYSRPWQDNKANYHETRYEQSRKAAPKK
jgi:hypothetical protein